MMFPCMFSCSGTRACGGAMSTVQSHKTSSMLTKRKEHGIPNSGNKVSIGTEFGHAPYMCFFEQSHSMLHVPEFGLYVYSVSIIAFPKVLVL